MDRDDDRCVIAIDAGTTGVRSRAVFVDERPVVASYREFAARVALLRKDYATAARHIEALVELEPDRPEHKVRLERLHAIMSAGG